MHGRWLESPLETFGGLCDTVPQNDLPPFMASRADDCAWMPGTVGKRRGFSSWAAPGVGADLIGLFSWASRVTLENPAGRDLVYVRADGTFANRNADGSAPVDPFSQINDTVAATVGVATAARYYSNLILTFTDGRRASAPARLIMPGVGALVLPTSLGHPSAAPDVTVLVGGGSMTAGSHTVWLTYEFVDGAMSPPTPGTTVTTAANDRLTIAPKGLLEAGGDGRLRAVWVWISPVGSALDGYRAGRVGYESPLLPTLTYGEADGVLTTARKADFLSMQRTAAPLLPAATVGPYKTRTCYIGAPHRYFVPGSSGTKGRDFHYGGNGAWTTPTAGGSFSAGDQYGITFDGASPSVGKITNLGTVVEDLGDLCSRGTTSFSLASWGLRVLAKRTAALANASLRFGAAGTGLTLDLDIPAASLGTDWRFFTLHMGAGPWPDDMKVFLEGIGPGVNGEGIFVRSIEVYNPASRVEDETAWWSRPGFPREVDLTRGAVNVGTGSGHKLRGGFELGDRFFYVADRSLWVTVDNGGEPSQWPLEKVAEGVGACSYRAWATTRDWAVLANENGCWAFTGGAVTEDANLAREIRETWKRIAWDTAGDLVWVEVLESLRQIWIGVPLDGALEITHALVLDYTEGLGSGLSAGGVGRRWSIWSVASPARACEFVDSAGEELVLVGRDASILKHDLTTWSDAGTEYGWAWQGGPIGPPQGGLGLFRRLLVSAEGNGTLGLALVKADTQLVPLVSPTLYTPRRGDQVALCSISDERVAVRFYQAAVASTWARVSRAALSWMQRPFAHVRPHNP